MGGGGNSLGETKIKAKKPQTKEDKKAQKRNET
jgi:hypothetical protein